MPFTREFFQYFDEARSQTNDEAWFKANEGVYRRVVAEPFAELVAVLDQSLAGRLPGIDFSLRKISRPIKRNSRLGESVVRKNVYAHFAASATSQFEMNPGMYVSLGAGDDDNLLGAGIYAPSSRQMRLLRPKLLSDYKQVRKLLGEEELKKFWGGLAGERYRRFPKGLDETAAGAEYLWHKQFFLHRPLSHKEVLSAGFAEWAADGFRAAVPFLNWARDTVGVYRSAGRSAKELDMR